ncbi:MAG: hypothetical protein CSA29_04020 [Desulfobacterales bacterium]|nr:MAG: hypothetical protein CSA29_04020 [Desulfobacterales bacterium]
MKMKRIRFFLVTTLLFLCVGSVSAYASAPADPPVNGVIEEINAGYPVPFGNRTITAVEFTVQTGTAPLIAFAVGNNTIPFWVYPEYEDIEALNYDLAFVDSGSPLYSDWSAAAINKDMGDWKIVTPTYQYVNYGAYGRYVFDDFEYSNLPAFFPQDFLESLTDNGYESAFLYYSSNGSNALDSVASYNGFIGLADYPQSSYVALGVGNSVYTGGTSHASVPIPGSALLLFIGLASLIKIKCRS